MAQSRGGAKRRPEGSSEPFAPTPMPRAEASSVIANGSAASGGGARSWTLWGSVLSPFALKVDALCDFSGLPHRWLPPEAGRSEGLRAWRRVRRLSTGRLPLTWPRLDPLDELPLTPFLLGPDGENLFDSSAIGEWLDRAHPGPYPLLPRGDPALRLAVRLVDEHFDEFGLYMVHHNRWVVSARGNDAGARLARDFRPVLGPLAQLLAHSFPARQVRRLPYLFSVAPGDAGFDDLPPRLRPPAREGFPPTHLLLEERFARTLAVLEKVLAARPYLFGERFTLADASVYGQLMMNVSDPCAEAWMRREAPRLRAWLDRIAAADFAASRADGALALDEAVRPLLGEVVSVLVPLLQQNRDAWQRHAATGEAHFNERAFDAGRSLYDGALAGHPFRAVAKTFQVRVWRSLREEWDSLADADRARLEALLPAGHGLDRSGACRPVTGSTATAPTDG